MAGLNDTADVTVTTSTAEETQALGETLGRVLRPGDLILLQGTLGSGKTTFTQGVARGMGSIARVTSPSFTLANVYHAVGSGVTVNHLDLWRIKSAEEALGIGLEEYLADNAVCMIEWPEVAASVFPDELLRIRFRVDGDRRTLAFFAEGKRGDDLVAALRQSLGARSEDSGGSFAPGN